VWQQAVAVDLVCVVIRVSIRQRAPGDVALSTRCAMWSPDVDGDEGEAVSGERLMHDPWERRPPRRRHLGDAVPVLPVAPVEVAAVPPVEAADPEIGPEPE
jgi:hypothetical protein